MDNSLIEQTLRRTGAYIMGKRMFEEGEVNWPEDLYKIPVYVITHHATLGAEGFYGLLLHQRWH